MIKLLSLENFKCFRESTDFRFSNLTLISGINGAGKSSVIQTLLILRQSWFDKFVDLHSHIKIDGDLVNIGDTGSLRNVQSTSPFVRIGLSEENLGLEEVSFEIDTSSIKSVAPVSIQGPLDELASKSALFAQDFLYLYADRIIPERRYRRTSDSLTNSRLGDKQGSNTAFRLYQAITDNEVLGIADFQRDGEYVVNNVSAWLNYILGGYSLRLSATQESTDEVSIKYYVKNENGIENEFYPENVAFGNSYILPIILGVLTAKRGSMIIIENPEAHLHPAAQTRMGMFLSIAAKNGVQVIIESHSEHLMNGIRLSVKDKTLTPDQVEFCFIDIKKGAPQKTRIPIEEDGQLLRWPLGFFDEWEQSLIKISV